MTFVPVNQHLWTKDNALMFGYADPYNKRQKREPDAMIMKVDGVYKCAVGPDWNAEFVAEVHDSESAKYECLMGYTRKRMEETK